ncbi:hypothetical protein IE53DRAFT_308409 [Violaceomyces palustris]|uniref:Uncharacterized protein n=1 Tax=Violaceomyces palustris TaxID=1673888 RepID=A0ACD0P8U8_9BASI|nr:hypothetical protein IE53DRAFT_308409 [Violaceomyces palustris]
MQAHQGPQTACSKSGDPNFPEGLRITPSSLNRARFADGQSAEVNSRWDQDNVQDIQEFGIAGRIWEAAYALALYLRPPSPSSNTIRSSLGGEESPRIVFDPPCSIFSGENRGSVVAVELGSGAGFAGLHLARQLKLLLGENNQTSSSLHERDKVILTDLPNVVPLLERNTRRAGFDPTDRGTNSSPSNRRVAVTVRPASWGNQKEAQDILKELSKQEFPPSGSRPYKRNPLSHIICSDLVYFPELLPPLLRSLIFLSEPGEDGHTPEVVISYKIRSLTKEQPFWSAFGAWFDFVAVDCAKACTKDGVDSQRLDWHRFGSERGDLSDSLRLSDELFVFVGKRREESFGCRAPEDNEKVMDGCRLRKREKSDSQEDADEGEDAEFVEESGQVGQDMFEWLLLSGIES